MKEEIRTGKDRKPYLAIVLCNLFLSLTVVFFQPLEHMLVHLKDFQLRFEEIWWVQLLLALGLVLALSGLMMIFPPRLGRIASSASISAGIAFLAQALLFNDGRPLKMNTNWPIEMLNIFTWFGIVIIIVTMETVYYSKEQGRKTEKVLVYIAWFLISIQIMSFTILATPAKGLYPEQDQKQQEQTGEPEWINIEKNMAKISMFRGMPFLLKDCFKYDMKTMNAESFKKQEEKQENQEGKSDEGWELTQYPDLSGNVGLFYSLYHPADGTLILIDSGNPANAEQVNRMIEDHGGHINAWFLTHYHGDHIGAFNELWEKYRDQIDVIYVNPLDWETFAPIYHDWDTPEAFSAFLEETKDADNVVTLYSGDELEIAGLKIKVFSSFDEHVRELSTDWPNDSSLVMKFSGKEESLLILGDLSRAAVPLGQYIIDTYGVEEVRADYIQAGHHGNWGQPISFYEQLMPKVIFQDCPEWVMTGEEYDAKDLAAWCAENGIITYDYRQAPTTVIIH